MIHHEVRVRRSAERLPRDQQLAWKLAELARMPAIGADTAELVAARVIDNAGVALAAINRKPVAAARAMALANPRKNGASLFGLGPDVTVAAEWAAWANATAVRELDFHDTFLAADYAHPGDSIASRTSALRRSWVSAASSTCRRRWSIRPSTRPCTSPSPRGSRARARSAAGRPSSLASRASSRSRRSTAPCAARRARARSTRARTP